MTSVCHDPKNVMKQPLYFVIIIIFFWHDVPTSSTINHASAYYFLESVNMVMNAFDFKFNG
jgi:hypothetical protein